MSILDLVRRANLSPVSISLCVLAFVTLGGLIYWQFKPSKRLSLPYFYVGSDVVATLEEAHAKVCTKIAKRSEAIR